MSNAFTIEVEKGNTRIMPPNDVAFNPSTWSKSAVGGCQSATIPMSGPADGVWQTLQWLGHKIRIYNHLGDLVWWGHVNRVEINDGAFSAGMGLDEMSNRIRVAYTYSLPDNTQIRGNTDWAQDDASIDRYGIRELQHSAGTDVTDAAALEMRNSLIEQLKLPIPTFDAGVTTGLANGAIYCNGDFSLNDLQYYLELRGLEESNTTGAASVPVGYGFSTDVSWISGDDEFELWTHTQALDGLEKGTLVDVVGGSNAGLYTIDGTASGEIETFTSTVDFTADDTIDDPDGVLGKWANGDVIVVTGTPNNNGYRRVNSVVDKDKIKVKPKTISTAAAVPNTTISRGYSVKLVEKPPVEIWGQSATVTPRGYILAQSFTLSNDVDPWTCDTISVRIKRVGSPINPIKVELRSDGTGAPSASVLASNTLAASTIYDTRPAWYEFGMGNVVSLIHGVTYWIVVSVDGGINAENYYEISIDEDGLYTTGAMKMRSVNGSWHDRPVNATMPFIVRGKESTTAQMTNLITNYSQFIEGVEFVDPSTVEVNQFRVGDTTALVELKKFLEMGVDGARRYICHVTPERRLVVYQEPTQPDIPQLAIGADGQVQQTLGGIYPAGRLPAGSWLDVRTPHVASDALSRLTPFFVERAEYDADSGKTRLEPRRDDPFDIKIGQG